MQLLTQWTGVSKYLLWDPATFYDHYDESHGIGYPLVFLATSYLVVVLPLFLLSVASSPTDPASIARAAGTVLVLAIALWLWTLVEAAIAHGILSLFGASGYTTTLEAYAFPSVIRYGLVWIPLVGIAVGFVGLYLQARGLGRFHDVSESAAAFAVILAALAPVFLLVLVAVVATFVFGFEAPSGTQPPIAAVPF